jgi:diaminohydroxyphosphoribosylaminopyrimidine deaminase/5-amino-6-(5-phosphoribosylamino)uracil reductase
VEGGPFTLNHFIQKGLWDEARIITATKSWKSGIPSPEIHGKIISQTNSTGDLITILAPIQ